MVGAAEGDWDLLIDEPSADDFGVAKTEAEAESAADVADEGSDEAADASEAVDEGAAVESDDSAEAAPEA